MKHLIKDPPSVHILMDRGLAGAIDYYVRDQILHFNEEKGRGIIRLDLDQGQIVKTAAELTDVFDNILQS